MVRPVAEAAIDIAAPIEIIWQAMIDLPAYPDWNPFIVRVEAPSGPPAVGQRLRLHVRWGNGGQVISPEIITRSDGPVSLEEGRKVAALAYRYDGWPHRLHLVRGTRLQTVEQTAGAPARYRTREEFSGLLVMLLPLGRIQDGFLRHAQALKERTEMVAGRSR